MESFIYDKRGYENIIVSFGSIVGLFGGVDSGEFRKTLNKFNTDILFLFDNEQVWYNNGIGGEINTIHKLSEFIVNFTKEYENVGFLGSSMGGYGAILLSHYCNPSSVLTFSPQTVIGNYKQKVMGDLRFSRYESKIINFDDFYFNLSKFDYTSDIHIYYGDKEIYDSEHAKIMDGKVIPHPIDTEKHNIAGVLKNRELLDETILNSFTFLSFI